MHRRAGTKVQNFQQKQNRKKNAFQQCYRLVLIWGNFHAASMETSQFTELADSGNSGNVLKRSNLRTAAFQGC